MSYNSSRWHAQPEGTSGSQSGASSTNSYKSSITYLPPPAHAPVNLVIEPAGFGSRFWANAIDSSLITGLVLAGFFIDPNFRTWVFDNQLVANAICLLVVWLYYAGMEASSTQGTLGKSIMGLKVTDMNGERISFLRATGRYMGKALSNIFYLGFIMIAMTEKKQGLHDMMAGCLVVKDLR